MKQYLAISILAALIPTSPAEEQHVQKPADASVASPQAVCALIAGRMSSALPQIPTFCSGKQQSLAGHYDISIFSPKNVLGGDLRRSWSSALFQTLEELGNEKALKGACTSTTSTCEITISDVHTAQNHWHYRFYSSKDFLASFAGRNSWDSDFSEGWYLNWWRFLANVKKSDDPKSEEEASRLGKAACQEYTKALQSISRRIDEIPACSVMLATDKSVYLALDYKGELGMIYSGVDYQLLPTVGRYFDNSDYEGQVIVRSPWTTVSGSLERFYGVYPLRGIEFVYEEFEDKITQQQDDIDINSDRWIAKEVSIESDAESLLRRFWSHGQTQSSTFLDGKELNPGPRSAAILRQVAGPIDSVVVDTTDGSEWKVARQALDRCKMAPGKAVYIDNSDEQLRTLAGNKLRVTVRNETPCLLEASFIKGW